MLPTSPRAALTIARTYGPRGAALRAVHELRRTFGWFRAAPRHPSMQHPTNSPFAVDAERLRAAVDRDGALRRGERVVAGEYEAFRWDWRPLPAGREWLANPFTGYSYDVEAPWWTVAHLHPAAGDIKDVWEPARFGWMYDLVRAALVTGDARFCDALRLRLAGWLAVAPPFRGVHWSCGQETAIRAVALLYAEANCGESRTLSGLLAASGERIDDALGYAISQRNNHAISEAAGLVALGARFKDVSPAARRWLARGARWLSRLVVEQFAEDGWYIQHSFTYLRLALDQCVVAERALRGVGETLRPDAVARLRSAAALLTAVIEPSTGVVPNHGANDGAFVHPITSAAYRDFRPVITAVCATWKLPMPADLPRCRETLAWLGLEAPPVGPALHDGVVRGASGWAAARVGATHVFLRAGRYTSRPSHIDALHVDVRFGPNEIVVDPGTYAYGGTPPWRNGLVGGGVHNGPLVDGKEPGVRGPRFLWYEWPRARLVSAAFESGDGDDACAARFVAELPGRVRREVRVTRHSVVIEDRLLARDASTLSVCWLLHPDVGPDMISVSTATEELRAAEHDVRGWFSPSYGLRLASRALLATRRRGNHADVPGSAIITTTVHAAGAG